MLLFSVLAALVGALAVALLTDGKGKHKEGGATRGPVLIPALITVFIIKAEGESGFVRGLAVIDCLYLFAAFV